MAFIKNSTVPLEVTTEQPDWVKKANDEKKLPESDNTSDTNENQKEDK